VDTGGEMNALLLALMLSNVWVEQVKVRDPEDSPSRVAMDAVMRDLEEDGPWASSKEDASFIVDFFCVAEDTNYFVNNSAIVGGVVLFDVKRLQRMEARVTVKGPNIYEMIETKCSASAIRKAIEKTLR
jgi:hypothetical protein